MKISKSKKLHKKHLKAKNSKIQKSYKEASNKKCSVNKLQLELKNIRNDIIENFEN